MPIDKRDDLISGTEGLCRQLASYAVEALLEEAVLYPKPGLVDPVSAGAHTDMDIAAFMRSAAALPFGFYEYARIGSGLLPPEPAAYSGSTEAAAVRRRLRTAGLALERTMFAATGGVNTHKGAVFIFGYLLAAAGRLYSRQQLPADNPAERRPAEKLSAAEFFSELRFLAAGLFAEDMTQAAVTKTPTHGQQMFFRYGCKGIRGEMEAGLPLVERNLAYLETLSARAHLPQREMYLLTLLRIIAENEDTNVLYRGGPDGLKDLQTRCRSILNAGLTGAALYGAAEQLDAYCIAQNISPGGSADLFAAVLFCRRIITIGLS